MSAKKDEDGPRRDGKAARTDRLAAELRANLRRRKAAEDGRAEAGADSGPATKKTEEDTR